MNCRGWPASLASRRCSPTTTTSRRRSRATRPCAQRCAGMGIAFHTFKDQVIFERDELLTRAGTPYSVFTPYRTAWLAKLDAFDLRPYPVRTVPRRWPSGRGAAQRRCPHWTALGFAPTNLRDLADSDRRIRRRAGSLPTSSSGSSRLPSDARLPGGQGPQLPERAPAVRHRVDPRTRRARPMRWRRKAIAGAATWLASSSGAISTSRCSPISRMWRTPSGTSHSFKPAYDAHPVGTGHTRRRRCSRPGARAAPATRWSMRPWRRSTRPATCTTACAWWSPAS